MTFQNPFPDTPFELEGELGIFFSQIRKHTLFKNLSRAMEMVVFSRRSAKPRLSLCRLRSTLATYQRSMAGIASSEVIAWKVVRFQHRAPPDVPI